MPPVPPPGLGAFRNTPDTDPSLPGQPGLGAARSRAAATRRLGVDTIAAARRGRRRRARQLIVEARAPGRPGGRSGADERAAILHRAGERAGGAAADLLEVMASEAGKTIDQGDLEVSEAIDFAHYYAERAKELDAVDGAAFVPSKLTVVTPPWNFPVAIPAGGRCSRRSPPGRPSC